MALTVTHPTPADGTFSAAGELAWEEAHTVSGTATPEAHAASHESAGSDPLNVKNLGGFPGGTTTFLRADAAFATPATVAHAASHESVGSDALNVKNLAGYPGGTSTFLRADSTFAAPATLAHAASHESAGSDSLNIKNLGGYPGGTSTFLRADGAFATPATVAHAASHESAGSDPLNIKNLGGYPGGTTTFLRADGAFASPGASSTNIKQTEIDFGATPVSEMLFTITDADVSATSQLLGWIAYEAPTGKDLDEMEMDVIDVKLGPGTGEFTAYVKGLEGYLADKFKLNYLIG